MANLRAGTTVGGDAVFTVGNISSYGLNFLNGNVGIGTAAPSKTLTIDGNLLVNKRDVDNGNPTMLLNSGGAADHATLDIYDKDGNDGARITANGDSWLSAKGGNVGIGTTNPLHKLHVRDGVQDGSMSVGGSNDIYGLQFSYDQASATVSTIRANTNYTNNATLLKISTNNNTDQLVLQGNGNVGIGTAPSSYKLSVAGSINAEGAIHSDSFFLKSSAYEMWHRDYIVRVANPQPILTESGVDIAMGGAYRVTAHIPSTGTHTGASAVFWNSDGVWYVNHTVQPTESSNHIGFYVSGDNKPRIQTWHTADYSISVLHERVFLGESSTENTRYLFGMDGLLSYRSDSRLYLNGYTADGSTTDTTTIASDKGKRILHQTSSYSGWDVYKLSENGLLMANDSAADNIYIGANTTYDSGGFKSLAAGRSSWGYLGGGAGDQVFAVFTDLSTVAGEVIQTANNEMFSVTNTTTYDHGNANVHAGNIATYLPDHNHNASEITAGTLSSARIPAATDTSLGGVKVSYDTITKTLSITTI